MDARECFEKTMNGSINMALATSVNDKPNVRVVTFGYSPDMRGRLFFTTFKGNQKIKEFDANPNVSCMPLPDGPESDTQVRIFGEVRKSEVSIDELIGMIEKKCSGNADTIREGGDMMVIYEVCFSQAHVTIGMNPSQLITFE